jgi:enterochelin esterase-like enzyme
MKSLFFTTILYVLLLFYFCEAQEPLKSKRLILLEQELQCNPSTLASFWEELKVKQAPLIEEIEGDAEYSLVTFLWQEKEPLKSIVIQSRVGFDLSTNQMTHLEGTDLWYKTYRVKNDVRSTYLFLLNMPPISLYEYTAEELDRLYQELKIVSAPDPYNSKKFLLPKDLRDENDNETLFHLSVLEMPKAPYQTYVQKRSGVPAGCVTSHTLSSHILGNDRIVSVYTPPRYSPNGQPYALLVLFDREVYEGMIPTSVILDNLLHEKRIVPLVAVLIGNSTTSREIELTCSLSFTQFLKDELMPWVHEHYHVSLDAQKRVVGGLSLGGLAATFTAFTYPELFDKVLSQSGAFWWRPLGEKESGWLIRQLNQSQRLPLEFYLDIGLLEATDNAPLDEPNLLEVNRHLRDVLQSKGYVVHYAEFSGGHDCISWQGTLSDGLIELLGEPLEVSP